MGYRVKTPEGELSFASLYDIERAYAAGLVDENDEVQEEGSEVWRKAGTLPALRHTRPVKPQATPWRNLVLFAVVGGVVDAFLLLKGLWLPAIIVALLVCALASRVTYGAFKKKPTE